MRFALPILASALSFFACPGLTSQIKVMPLGDSITQAERGQYSYRHFLWKQLRAAGYCVDFVGSEFGNYRGNAIAGGFDQDHQGIWGIRTDEVAKDIVSWMRRDMPDVVVCHIGTNDFWQSQSLASTITDMEFLIDEMRRANPAIRILLAKVIPVGPRFNIDVRPLNDALPGIVARKQHPTSRLILVDHFTGWDNSIHSYDDVHSTELGDRRMADTWFQAFDAMGLPKCRVNSDEVRILPLGDSITESDDGRTSYRYFLWNEMRRTGHCPDFVGSKWGVANGQAKHNGFDQDHDGRKHETTKKLAARTYDLVKDAKPEVILLHIGNVDMFNKTPVPTVIADIGRVIDEARRADPSVTILLAQIVPFDLARYPTVDVTALNNAMPALVSSKNSPTSPVRLVDHYTGWDPAALSWDGVHPNEQGDARMADTWLKEILNLDIGCIADFAEFGAGCLGSNGVPELTAALGSRPVLGGNFSLEFSKLPPGAPTMAMIGFSDLAWSGLPLPLPLGFMGAPGCDLLVSMDYLIGMPASPFGSAKWTLPVPTNPVFSGFRFYLQAYTLDPRANLAGLITSNAGVCKLGKR